VKLVVTEPLRKFPEFYGKPNVHNRVHINPPLVSILNWANPVHNPQFTSLRSILILSSHLRLDIRSDFLPSDLHSSLKWALDVALSVSRRLCSNRRHMLASGWRRPGQRSVYSRTAIPTELIEISGVRTCRGIRSQATSAVHCESGVHLTTHHVTSWQQTLLRSMSPH
jgi:hypothetical protein